MSSADKTVAPVSVVSLLDVSSLVIVSITVESSVPSSATTVFSTRFVIVSSSNGVSFERILFTSVFDSSEFNCDGESIIVDICSSVNGELSSLILLKISCTLGSSVGVSSDSIGLQFAFNSTTSLLPSPIVMLKFQPVKL